MSTSDPLPEKLTLVLVAGVIVVGVSSVANSLIGDYRNGYLLRVPPRAQFAAQAIGTLASGLTATGMFTLFAAAYPVSTLLVVFVIYPISFAIRLPFCQDTFCNERRYLVILNRLLLLFPE